MHCQNDSLVKQGFYFLLIFLLSGKVVLLISNVVFTKPLKLVGMKRERDFPQTEDLAQMLPAERILLKAPKMPDGVDGGLTLIPQIVP